MDVAIVCPYSYARPGGVQEQTRGLAVALHDRGHRVRLLAPDLHAESESLDGIEAISLGRSLPVRGNGSVAPLGVDPRMLRRLPGMLRPADVVHVHEPFQPLVSPAALLRAPSGIPVVGTFHAAGDRFLPYRLARPALRLLARRLSATTATSEASKEYAHRYTGVDPVLVPNGVDVAGFADATPDPWMSGLGTTVLFVGRPEPRKGFATAVRAFVLAAAGRPDLHFVCNTEPGSSPELPADVAGRVHFLGPQPAHRLRSLFRAADVYVAPNTGRESFGVILAEAMAAGTAVIASDIPGFRAAGGDAIRYVSPGDAHELAAAVGEAADDPAARCGLVRSGRDRVRMFDWGVVAARFVEVFEQAAS